MPTAKSCRTPQERAAYFGRIVTRQPRPAPGARDRSAGEGLGQQRHLKARERNKTRSREVGEGNITKKIAKEELALYALGEIAHDLREARRKAEDRELPRETRKHYLRVAREFEAERDRLRDLLIPKK
ncbi:MAG TPA: hypothetical protein VGP42_15890 [Stellaceae bacterium]|nr:hypothetical protein [Stellaceae bacterium]